MSQDTTIQSLVLAAGKGTRMKSSLAKVMHEVLGLPMLGHVVRAAAACSPHRIIVVLGHGRAHVSDWLTANTHPSQVQTVAQTEQLGTGHAVWAAREALAGQADYTLILSGDVPNLSGQTLRAFAHDTLASGAPLGLMTAVVDDAGGYGRILRDGEGQVAGIIEYKDASAAQRNLQEFNVGTYLVRTDLLLDCLTRLVEAPPENAQGEYYLTDIVAMARERGEQVHGWTIPEVREVQGVNTRVHLAEATRFARERINTAWMEAGVTLLDPDRVTIEPDVILEPDVVLYPDVYLKGSTHVSGDVIIEPGCVVCDSRIERGAHLLAHSYLHQARVGQDAKVGPFAHLRPGAELGEGAKVGNFVEVKNSRLGPGAKASHLTYLGDAEVGAGANIGAGTITCNYDGKKKHPTVIGAGAFIGSNAALVAPIRIGEHAYVGAGSTLTLDVPDNALGVARSKQRNIEGWAARKKGGG